MRHLLVAAALACAASPVLAADPVEGDWLTPGGSAKVRIAPCQGRPDRLCGAIVWLRDALDKAGRPVRDTANPDPALRGRALVGLPFIRDFRRVETARWTGGKIYDPQTGKTYDSRLRLNPDGTLKLEGCVLVVCQGQTWRRPG